MDDIQVYYIKSANVTLISYHYIYADKLLVRICHATSGSPPHLVPPDHLRQIVLLWMVPPDQLWLPWMVRFAASSPQAKNQLMAEMYSGW